jgi:hypothetical protein
MATIPSYPQADAGPEDLLLGINIMPDVGVDPPKTRSFPVSSIISLATAAVPAFIPSDYDLDEFTNENVDPFAKISDIPVLGYTPVNKAGDTMSGNLILNADPSNALGAATKQYVDSGVVKPYKVYTALLTQSGETAPVPTILENTIGNITISRGLVGIYWIDSSNLFTVDKTFTQITTILFGGAIYSIAYSNSSRITIVTTDASGAPIDGRLYGTPIEIRVYN